MNLLVDTNCALYLLGGDQTLADFLDGKVLHVSFITELELLSYPSLNDSEESAIREFLSDCFIVDINASIKQQTIRFRRGEGLKLPDSIIAATSASLGIPLLTADADFKSVAGLEVIFYSDDGK